MQREGGGIHALQLKAPLEPSDSEAGAFCRNKGLIATRPSRRKERRSTTPSRIALWLVGRGDLPIPEPILRW